MAEHAHDAHGDYHRGEMDIREQANTFSMFNKMAKWGSLVLAVSLLFLTMWFATEAGFLAALVTSFVLAVVGVWALRERKGGSH
jgi:hypothetical protein